MLREEIEKSRQEQWDGLRDFLASYAVRSPVRKVGVVGNAPLEPSRDRADELDSADLVIRVNSLVMDEPTDPPCLGRTCHAVLLARNTNFTPYVFRDHRERAYLVMQLGFTSFHRIRKTAEYWPAGLGAMPVPNEVVTRRLADLLDPDREGESLLPTTGTTAVFLAHELFPEAEMVATGFSFLHDRGQTQWDHHFGGTVPVDERHKLEHEGRLLQSWVDEGSMRYLP